VANVAVWRQQEQLLIERWREATERHRAAHAELAARAQGAGAPDEALLEKAKAANAELEALRRQVARLKRDFLTGKRY
jgi:hypothetical protein